MSKYGNSELSTLKYGDFSQKFPKKKSFQPSFGDPFFHCQVVKMQLQFFSDFFSFLLGVKKKKLTGEQKIMII
jgi:hypothetical protein